MLVAEAEVRIGTMSSAEAAEQVRKAAESKPLDEMTVDELHELAAERKILGRSKMHKAELIEVLQKS